jgi:cell division protein FtsW
MEDSIYRLSYREILTLCVMGLLFLGIIMVQSASMHVTGQVGWQWTRTGAKHAGFAAVALMTFWLVGYFDYARLARKALWHNPIIYLTAIAALACAVVLVPHVGMQVNGARRWLPLGPLQIQPSELAKWSVVMFLAYWLAYRPVDMNSFTRGFLPTMAPVAGICLLIVIQDFGTAALIAVCSLAMCFVGRVRMRHLLIVLLPVLLMGFWFLHHKEYRWRRIVAFENPYAAPQREGYHMIQSLLSFTSGGLMGKGLGNGVQKLGYLPEDTTDFIFAVICEEMGLFGALLTIAFYIGIIFVAYQLIRQKRDSFGRLLAFGITCMLALQALINIAVATVSVPTKGLPLPLISAGGSGLVITCASLGLLRSVARYDHDAEEEEQSSWELQSTALATAL